LLLENGAKFLGSISCPYVMDLIFVDHYVNVSVFSKSCFLPRDALQSAVMLQYVVCLSVRLSVRP